MICTFKVFSDAGQKLEEVRRTHPPLRNARSTTKGEERTETYRTDERSKKRTYPVRGERMGIFQTDCPR